MRDEDLRRYIDWLLSTLPLDRYVERRFTAASESAGVPVDMEFRFRGILREREPKLEDVLKHARVLILAEPGAGKSVVARAAVHQTIVSHEHVPIFAELKGYRGDLAALVAKAVPAEICDLTATIEDKRLSRTYIFDGIDEIPDGLLPNLGTDLDTLFQTDAESRVLLTARQAFHAAHSDSLPALTSVFHILDFSDEDIKEYLGKSGTDTDGFLDEVQRADANEEIRNPFILSVMAEKYRDAGALSDRRSENVSHMIDRLIQSRPRVNQHQQRRALRMLGVALETYSRNELTEDEAFQIIREAMRIPDAEAHALLEELYASIIRRTTNGLGFQLRSYGEYLAAEALEGERMERIRELAFLDYSTPNETWLNTISYLAELNPAVRKYFVRQHPLWMISVSPAVFSKEEKTSIVTSALEACVQEKQYLPHHPLIHMRRLSRFVTGTMEKTLLANISEEDHVVQGNALALLGVLRRSHIVPIALAIVNDRTLGTDIRYCAIAALVNSGTPACVSELLAALDSKDQLYINILDTIGALIDESQIPTVLPLLIRENAMLSAAYYHFRELKTREALVQVLLYFLAHPDHLNVIREEAYVEPVLELLPTVFDAEIAHVCAEILEVIEAGRIFPDSMGILRKLLALMRRCDNDGEIMRLFLERAVRRDDSHRRWIFFIDPTLVWLITPRTAQWLIDIGATELIQQVAPYCRGEIREMLRPHCAGVIDAQDASTSVYRDEESKKEESRIRRINALQASLVSRTSLDDALKDFWELKEDYWPELPEDYRNWLSAEISKCMRRLDLERSIRWEDTTLWQPEVLPFLLRVIDRYALRIEPDEPLAFVVIGLDTEVVAKYQKRFGLGENAIQALERMLDRPPSSRAREGVVRFIQSSGIWSPRIEASLSEVAADASDLGHIQDMALALVVAHGVDSQFIEGVASAGASKDLRNHAFEILVERQHRATIERALSRLNDDEHLRAGNVTIPDISPLAWLMKIKSDFAWDKLADLRAKSLQLELPMLVSLLTETIAKIDRTRAAALIRRQVPNAHETWRTAQITQAIEQERIAKIEAAQRTPFDEVLRKLKGSTSINRLKVLCEGIHDQPVFETLIAQAGSAPEIILDVVGGWSNLRAKPDPQLWLLGCKEVVIVMDGDNGRHLDKEGKPLSDLARQEAKKISALPIELHVLERYGIENYFPKIVFETVLGTDLSAIFPIPDDVSVVKYLATCSIGWPKNRNAEAARHLSLEDLRGTDLYAIVHQIVEKANQIADE